MKNKIKRDAVPNARKEFDDFKVEVSNELGITNYDQMNEENLTSVDDDYISENLARKMLEKEYYERKISQNNNPIT